MFSSKPSPDLSWVKIPPVLRGAGEAVVLVEAARQHIGDDDGVGLAGFRELLATVGVPTVAGTPEQELVALLQHASAIEHGLMLQYLYSSYSRSDDVGPTLRFIAIEEMGHFLTVQNLLLACGESPVLAHGDWVNAVGLTPFAFRLEPASSGSLAKYAVVEMPDPDGGAISEDQKESLKAIIPAAIAAAGHDVKERRVGLLYAKIYWLLRANDKPMDDPAQEPWTGFPVTDFAAKLPGRHISEAFLRGDGRQGTRKHWGADQETVIIKTIASRDDALSAIAEVSAQGEGFGATPDGHFDRFVNGWAIITTAGAPLSTDMAINPWVAGSASANRPGATDEIKSDLGVAFARAADAAYEFTLVLIGLYLILPETTPANLREQISRGALTSMTNCLAKCIRDLRTIPLVDGAGTKVCGPPFSISGSSNSPDTKALVELGRARLAEIIARTDEIVAAPQSNHGQKTTATKIAKIVRDDLLPILDGVTAFA